MNSILGLVGTVGVSAAYEQAERTISSSERGQLQEIFPGSNTLRMGATQSGGAVYGRASVDGITLLSFGCFHGPVPRNTPDEPPPALPDDSDGWAQLLLQRYIRDGRKFLDNVCGQFAVAVVTPQTEQILLARGHGSAPRWFYRRSKDNFAFSTKLIDHALMDATVQIDRSLEEFLLGYEFLPGNRTPYRDVLVLKPGQALVWSKGEIDEFELPKPNPWRARFDEVNFNNEQAVVQALGEAFNTAVADQAPNCERVGVLLGGVDSAVIAVALKNLGKEVHTYSFQYDDDTYNQAFVEELAERYGLTHHWVPITPQVIQDGLKHFAERYNQVVAQPHYLIATTEVCRVAYADGIRHCLTGDGCDGLFMGYPTVHQRAKLIDTLSKYAPLFRAPSRFLTRSRLLEQWLGQPYRIARNVHRILERPMPARGHIAACTLDSHSLHLLRGAPPPQERGTEELLQEMAVGLESVGVIRLAYLGKGKVGLNAVKLDGSMSLAGVTLASPYLHPGMVAVAKSIPDELSRPGRDTESKATGKYAFLKMVEHEGTLPHEMIYQKKCSPVTSPVDHWYWGSLKVFLLDQLKHLPFDANERYLRSLLKPKAAEILFREGIGLSRYVTSAAALLACYASFSEATNSDFTAN